MVNQKVLYSLLDFLYQDAEFGRMEANVLHIHVYSNVGCSISPHTVRSAIAEQIQDLSLSLVFEVFLESEKRSGE